MRKIESLLIVVQKHRHEYQYIKAKIDNTQQNSKYRLCGDRDETIYHIISEFRELVLKEYMTSYDWVGKVIPRELCKKLKFYHTIK